MPRGIPGSGKRSLSNTKTDHSPNAINNWRNRMTSQFAEFQGALEHGLGIGVPAREIAEISIAMNRIQGAILGHSRLGQVSNAPAATATAGNVRALPQNRRATTARQTTRRAAASPATTAKTARNTTAGNRGRRAATANAGEQPRHRLKVRPEERTAGLKNEREIAMHRLNNGETLPEWAMQKYGPAQQQRRAA